MRNLCNHSTYLLLVFLILAGCVVPIEELPPTNVSSDGSGQVDMNRIINLPPDQLHSEWVDFISSISNNIGGDLRPIAVAITSPGKAHLVDEAISDVTLNELGSPKTSYFNGEIDFGESYIGEATWPMAGGTKCSTTEWEKFEENWKIVSWELYDCNR